MRQHALPKIEDFPSLLPPLGSMLSQEMKYDRSFLGRDGFLITHGMIPIGDGDRGLFHGSYRKDDFETLEEFALFAQNISSIAQDWYSSGDLLGAYGFYHPDERDICWTDSAQKNSGELRDWINGLGSTGIDLASIPSWNGDFYSAGDASEFGVVGATDVVYFEAFVGDT